MDVLDFIEQSGQGSGFVYKNTQGGYYFDGTSFLKITAPDYPPETVKGIVFLDGTYYVMTPDAFIYGSEINDPSSWDALNVISSQSEPDQGVCLARQLNLIVAFNKYSTEFFYNADQPPPGSPLLPYTSAFLEIGCAVAGSVINAENSIIFMSVGRQKGRSISILEGTVPKTLSTPYIDRILNADSLINVTSYFIKIQGHAFYVLCLPTSNLTLVCDTANGKWHKWTQLSKYFPDDIDITAMSWANGVVTVTAPGHNVIDGAYTNISEVSPGTYDGDYVMTYIDANTFSYEKASNPGIYLNSGEVRTYFEVPFNMASYAKTGSFDVVQDSTTGVIYSVTTAAYEDAGIPIRWMARTSNIDGGNNQLKFYSRLELIGDKVEGTAYLKYSDDDYQTWKKYRPVDLSNQRSQLYRLGSSRRRAYEIINYDNLPIRLHSIELSVDKGYT